jgi:chromosome segregation ATPase
MNLDDLPGQFEEFLYSARVALHQKVSSARTTLEQLKRETAAESKALADLRDQRAKTQANLDTNVANLNRAGGLAVLDAEIAEARKTLAGLKHESAEASKSLDAVKKQLKDAESRFNAVQTETQTMLAIRADSQRVMDGVRAQLGIGQRP